MPALLTRRCARPDSEFLQSRAGGPGGAKPAGPTARAEVQSWGEGSGRPGPLRQHSESSLQSHGVHSRSPRARAGTEDRRASLGSQGGPPLSCIAKVGVCRLHWRKPASISRGQEAGPWKWPYTASIIV